MMQDDDGVSIPAEFFQGLTEKEWLSICDTGFINKKLCRRLWGMLGRIDKPPYQLMLMLNREDVMREFPPITKQ